MRILCPISLGLISLAALVGCSAQPQVAAPAKPVPAVAAAKKAQAKPAAMAAVKDEDEFTPPPGYHQKIDNGRIYYCTKVVVLGSRFAKDDCRTQAQLEEMESAKGSMRGEITQRQALCTTAAGCVNP